MADGIVFRTEVTVELFPRAIDRLLDSPGGPTGQFVKRQAENVLRAAIPKIGSEYSSTTGKLVGDTASRKGAMKTTGKVVPAGDNSASWSVVFDHPVAFMHHEGTKQHDIGSPGKKLGNKNYPNTRAGHPIYKNRLFGARGVVTHPGTAGNPFLTNAATEVGLRPSGALRRGPTRQVPIFRSTTIG